jgi:hypothetical protein
MLMDWQNQCSKNGYITKSNLPTCLMQFPSKFQWHLSQRLKKTTLKFIWKHKRLWIAKPILSKNSKAGGFTIPNFKLYYRAIAIKADMNPCEHTQLIFDKGAKNIQWRKDSLFNKCCWKNWISACRKLQLDPCCYPVKVSTQRELRTLTSDLKPWS